MKNLFDAARYRTIATELGKHAKAFDSKLFLKLCLNGLDERELMDRLRQTALAFDAAMPGSLREKVAVLRAHAASTAHNFVGIWPCEFVALFGLDDPEFSLNALRDLTRHGSAEFAVRPFIERDQAGALAIMRRWADDPDEHVRRLASEGCRPRLPWGRRLTALVDDPSPTGPILEALKSDQSLYVRKSVANHLNDIAKDHPEAVLDRVEAWDRSDPRTAWIVRHGLRTLIKQGNLRALTVFGAGTAAKVTVAAFSASPARLRLGDKLALSVTLTGTGRRAQTLIIDYVLHYARASGNTAAKVFKWTTVKLAPGQSITLSKHQLIRDFSTRKHYPGKHRIELQINGQRLSETEFTIITTR